MIDTATWLYSLLSSDATLVALVGSTDAIVGSYPEQIGTFPLVIFRELDQPDILFADNLPQAVKSVYVIDVYVKNDTTQTIAARIATLLKAKYWACVYNEDSPDPDPIVRHRVMRFTRPLMPGEVA